MNGMGFGGYHYSMEQHGIFRRHYSLERHY